MQHKITELNHHEILYVTGGVKENDGFFKIFVTSFVLGVGIDKAGNMVMDLACGKSSDDWDVWCHVGSYARYLPEFLLYVAGLTLAILVV